MTDIVDRLRGRVHVREAAELLYAAAEEIERLRIVIHRAADAWMQCDGVAWEGDIADAVEAGVAEIARLREEAAAMTTAIQKIEHLEAEIARLRDELASATRHMELAEAAWLRETAGNSPVAVTLTPDERSAIADAADRYASITPESAATVAALRGLLERTK